MTKKENSVEEKVRTILLRVKDSPHTHARPKGQKASKSIKLVLFKNAIASARRI